MEKVKNPIIYLGYHKSGSKWMWKHLFNEFYDCKQVDIFNIDDYDIKYSHKQKVLRTSLEEGLMGSERLGLSKKIKVLFPNARIIVAIRSQRSMLPSHYTQYVRNGGRLGFNKYLNQVVKNKWRYSKLIEELHQDFGIDQVFVYLFEDFVTDKSKVLNNIVNFIEKSRVNKFNESIDRIVNLPRLNPRRDDLVIDTMLLLNGLRMRHRKNKILLNISRKGRDHIFVEVAEFLSKLYELIFSKKLAYREYDDNNFLDKFYNDENTKLSKILGVDLKALNYPFLK